MFPTIMVAAARVQMPNTIIIEPISSAITENHAMVYGRWMFSSIFSINVYPPIAFAIP